MSLVHDVTIDAGERELVELGLEITLPYGHVGLLKSRSSLSRKYGVEVRRTDYFDLFVWF